MDETLHGLIQDVEGGYIHSLAFVAPGRMAWPLPLYELALMTAGRASDMDVELATAIVTPEDSPLAIFGSAASTAVKALLGKAHIQTINTASRRGAELGRGRDRPGERHLRVDRVIALPELYGPRCAASHWASTVSSASTTMDECPAWRAIYAAGDATDVPRQVRRHRRPAGRRRRTVDRRAGRSGGDGGAVSTP